MSRASLLKALDSAAGPLVCRTLGACDYLAGARRPPAVMPVAPERILVIRPGGMGDMILLLPVLRLLRERLPGTAIDVVCERRNAGVLQLAGMDDSVLVYDAHPLRFLRVLQRRRYDAAMDTEQFHHFSAVLARASGAPVRVGFNINPRRNALYTHLVSYDPGGREGEQFLRLLQPLGLAGGRYDLEGDLRNAELPPPPLRPANLPEILRVGRFAVVHAGASTPYKQWPQERFADLLKTLHARHGLDVVLVGSRQDAARSRQIAASAALAGARACACAGVLNLAETATLIRRASVFIGVDSGLAHLAAALGTPSVALFGPSDPTKWGVEGPHHAVVRQPMACAPCFIFGYHKPCRHIACMQAITVSAVAEACERVMGS